MLMIAIYVIARRRDLPAEEWKGFGELMNGGKEAGWGLFLIVIIIGGIYGGVFTPTEAAAVAAVYAFFIALFVYRDMGPMAGRRWLKDDDARGTPAYIGFSATVYALAFFFVWMVLSFFVTGGLGERHRRRPRLARAGAFAGGPGRLCDVWRDPASNPLEHSALPHRRPAGLGPQSRADGPAFPRCVLPRGHAQGDGRFLENHHHADVHHRERAAVRPCADSRAHSPGDHRCDGRCGLHLVHLPDRGQPAAAARRPVHGAVRPAADRRPGRFPDRHGARRRSDPSRHHHGGQHGDRHDHPADRAEPVRDVGHHRHEPDPGRARRGALRRRAARLPDSGDLRDRRS
jgi:hypothetical protein